MQRVFIKQCELRLAIKCSIFEDRPDIPMGRKQSGEHFVYEREQVDQSSIIGDNA